MGNKYRYWRKIYTNRSTHTLNETNILIQRVCWDFSEQAAWEECIGVLPPLYKKPVNLSWLTSCQRWGEVSSVCPIRGPGAEWRGRLWGKSRALLSLSSGSRVQFSTGCTLGEPHLLMAQVSYWTTWESPKVFPLLAANALVKSRWRELLLCQCLPLLCLKTTKFLSEGTCTSLFCHLQRILQRTAPDCVKGRASGMLWECQRGKHAWCKLVYLASCPKL